MMGDFLDRGVQKDIWTRNLGKEVGPRFLNPGLSRLIAACDVLLEGKHEGFGPTGCRILGGIRRFACSGIFPTRNQLGFVNRHMEERGFPRVSCAVRELGKKGEGRKPRPVELFEARRAAEVQNLDKIAANRPLRPPGRGT